MQTNITNKRVEMLSVNYLKNTLLLSDKIDPQISDNDKEPSWDGFVLLHKDKKLKKDELIKISVQVKGTFKKKGFDGDSIQFPVSKRDLINYRNHNGVLYFVVQINDKNEYKIYYNGLLSTDINEILKKMGNKNTTNTKFFHFDSSNPQSMEIILLNFHNNQLKHCPSDVYFHNKDKFDRVVVHFKTYSDSSNDILFHSQPIYGVFNSLPNKLIPISRIEIKEISTFDDKKISINGHVYYEKIKWLERKNGFSIKIGESFVIDCNDPSYLEYNISLKGNLFQRRYDAHFVKRLIEVGKYSIDDAEFEFKLDKNSSDYLLKQSANLEKLFSLSVILGIKQDFNFDLLNDEELKMLSRLVEYFVDGNMNALSVKSNGILDLNIGNWKLKFLAIKQDDEKLNLVSIFTPNIHAKAKFDYSDGTCEEHSLLLTLRKDDFISLSNIDFDKIYTDVVELETNRSENFISGVILLLLQGIHGFDSSYSEDIYSFCCKLDDYLMKNDEFNIVNIINHFQLKIRKHKLTKEETSILINRKRDLLKEESNDELCFAISVLCGNRLEADYFLEKLSENSINELIEFPIYTLYKKMNN